MSSSVTIRQAELADIDRCLALDASYVTNEVWQLQVDTNASLSGVSAAFRAVRLTRTVRLPYPRTDEELQLLWHNDVTDLLVVGEAEQLSGYVDVTTVPDRETVWVYNLVVDRRSRRAGIGTRLFQAAAAWTREHGFSRLLFETPTKNGPALRFFFAHGAEFCGFCDRYYSNQDIAVFFEYRV